MKIALWIHSRLQLTSLLKVPSHLCHCLFTSSNIQQWVSFSIPTKLYFKLNKNTSQPCAILESDLNQSLVLFQVRFLPGESSGAGHEREHLVADVRLWRGHRSPAHPRRAVLPTGQSFQRIGSSIILLGNKQSTFDNNVSQILVDCCGLFLHPFGKYKWLGLFRVLYKC